MNPDLMWTLHQQREREIEDAVERHRSHKNRARQLATPPRVCQHTPPRRRHQPVAIA